MKKIFFLLIVFVAFFILGVSNQSVRAFVRPKQVIKDCNWLGRCRLNLYLNTSRKDIYCTFKDRGIHTYLGGANSWFSWRYTSYQAGWLHGFEDAANWRCY